MIRSELMEQVPHIAIYCQEVPDHLGHAVPHHLLPLVVKFLVDNNHQVSQILPPYILGTILQYANFYSALKFYGYNFQHGFETEEYPLD